MKIGIITFHWATNYGAVLQTFALQEVLENMGYDVDIINYKPKQYDDSIYSFFRFRKFLCLNSYIKNRRKEKSIEKFRVDKLHRTKRYYTEKSLVSLSDEYNAIITGSDQVMNPSFLMHGEGSASTAYFLGFVRGECKRIAYAVSFGVTEYPSNLRQKGTELLKGFSAISVRENTGIDICKSMGYANATLVPDPTLLLDKHMLHSLLPLRSDKKNSIFVYMLHNRNSFINKLNLLRDTCEFKYSVDEGITEWLSHIYYSKAMITNSFHGMVFCLHFHIPFVIVLKTATNKGMNDRFFTLLECCHLLNRITTELEFNIDILNIEIDWNFVDEQINQLRKVGVNFLQNSLKNKG